MKAWIKSKTVWAGVILIITGVSTFCTGGPNSEGVRCVAEGLGFIFLRSGLMKMDSGWMATIAELLKSKLDGTSKAN